MRRVLVTIAAIAVLGLTGIGLMTVAELAYRASGLLQRVNRGSIVDVNLFHYSPYVVSTMEPNLVLGNSGHILERRFQKGCRLDDGTSAIFNNHGFRSPEFAGLGAKEPDEVRIVITGGLAAMSWNISEACTLDQQIKTILDGVFPDKRIRIFNLANAGWQSFQELIALELYGQLLNPGIVVSFSGFNDFQHAFYMPVNRAYTAGLMEDAFRAYKRRIESGPLDFLQNFQIAKLPERLAKRRIAPGSRATSKRDLPLMAKRPEPGGLATRVNLPLDYAAIATRADFDPYNQRVVDAFVWHQRLMARALTTMGGVLISVMQPNLYMKEPLSDIEHRHLMGKYQPDVNFTVQA